MAMARQHKTKEADTAQADQAQSSTALETEMFTGAPRQGELSNAEQQIDDAIVIDESFTPILNAAWAALEASGEDVDDYDSDGLATHGMTLFGKVAEADVSRTMPSLSELAHGIIKRDGLTALYDNFDEHEEDYDSLLEAQPSYLPAWSADLSDDDEEDGPVATLERVHVTLADVIIAEGMIELCKTIKGDDETGQQALSELIRRYQLAPEDLRSYLMDAIEAQELGKLHIHNFLLGVKQADLLAEMDAADALLAEKVAGFTLDESGSGFAQKLGDLLELLGGRARTEFEAEGTINVPVTGPLFITGGAKVTVSRGADDLKATLHLEGGLGVGKADDTVSVALAAGYTLEASGSSGVQVAQLLQLGLLDSLAACKEEPPPLLFDLVLGTTANALFPAFGAIDAVNRVVDLASGKGRKSVLWGYIADAFVSPKERERLIEVMEDGHYVESFDQVVLKGEIAKDGNGAKANAKAGIFRRIEQKHGEIRESDWVGIKGGGEVAVGDDKGITAKFEMKDVLEHKKGAPPDSSAQIKLALEGSVTSDDMTEGMDLMFGAAGLGALKEAFTTADVQDQHQEQIAGMATVMAQAKALAARELAAKSYDKLPGVTLGLEVEAAFEPRTGTWTLSAALVSKFEADGGMAKGTLQRKEALGQVELDPRSAAE